MFYQDYYKLRKPIFALQGMEKLLFFLLLLHTAILSNLLFLHVFLLLACAIVFVSYGLSVKQLFHLILLPLGFVSLGCLSIAIGVHANEQSLFYFPFLGIDWGVEALALQNALALFFKAMASVMTLHYLLLSCSVWEINDMCRRLKVPLILRELFVLTYRYIVLLFTFNQQVKIAQTSRLGYVNRKASWRSISMLLSSVFIKSISYSTEHISALQSRGYVGEFFFKEEHQKVRMKVVFVMVLYSLIVVAIHLEQIGITNY